MISAANFIELASSFGFSLYTGVPCSYLQPFINYVIDEKSVDYIGATNEGDALAIASGAEFAGKRSVVMFQNSGLGNAVNPLTSLNMIFNVPVLLITTWRGQPGGAHDEPQHKLMGEITAGFFELMRIPWEYFPSEKSAISGVLERATKHMAETDQPYGLIMKKDSVEPYELKTNPLPKPFGLIQGERHSWTGTRPSRAEVLRVVQSSLLTRDVIVATTGHTGRELYGLADRENQVYMVGSMGCASSFGFGIAFSRPDLRVIVLDGDGAALMRLGALATIGFERPKNLIHILLDNEQHESTGGQSTASHSVDCALVAAACGYPRIKRIDTLDELSDELGRPSTELTFIHIKTAPKLADKLPRPVVTPAQIRKRFKHYVARM